MYIYIHNDKSGGTETEWDTLALTCADDANLLGDNIETINKNTNKLRGP
jgi:hypothetical protein